MKISRTPGPETSAARRDNPAVLKSTRQEPGGLSPTPESGRSGRGKTRGSLARTWRTSFWENARRRRCRAPPRGSVGSGVEDFGQALADDHARRMGVARGDGRHDRAVGDAEFF